MQTRLINLTLIILILAVLAAVPAAAQQERTNKALPSVFEEEIFDKDREPTMDILPSELIPLEGAVNRDEYLLGPGDWVQFSVWGTELPLTQNLYVSAEGRLLIIPEGAVQVAGMSLAAAEKLLEEKLEKYFTADLSVTLTLVNPRSFRAYVAGAVVTPGAYKATAMDRVSSLIRVAGGLRPGGSYRRIRIYDRQGSLLREADLMRYLANADMQHNPPLSDGMVVEVPAIDQYVTFSGEFPHIYGIDSVRINNAIKEPETQYRVEFLPGESLLDVLKYTGMPQMPDTSLVGNATCSDRAPGNGDVSPVTREMLNEPLTVGRYYMFPVRNNWVYVSGAITVGGRFQYRPGWTVQDYLGQAGGPTWNGSKKIYVRKAAGGEMEAGLGDMVYPGDAIFVPEKFHPERYLALGAGLLGTVIIVLFR